MRDKNLIAALQVLVEDLVSGPKKDESAYSFRCRLLVEWDKNRGTDKPSNWQRKGSK